MKVIIQAQLPPVSWSSNERNITNYATKFYTTHSRMPLELLEWFSSIFTGRDIPPPFKIIHKENGLVMLECEFIDVYMKEGHPYIPPSPVVEEPEDADTDQSNTCSQ